MRAVSSNAFGLLIVCFLTFPEPLFPARSIINLDIVSPGVIGNYTASSINLSGPAFDVSISRLRERFLAHFNISHTFLYNYSILNCVDFQNEVQNMLARWYYTVDRSESVTVIMTPGCIESAQLNELAATWNVLLISTANSAPAIRDKAKSPSWVTTNLFPSSYYGEIFNQLIVFHNWTSIDILLDRGSTGSYVLMFSLTIAVLENRKMRATNRDYNSSSGEFEFPAFLQRVSTRNRILLFLGSPNELRKLLVAASWMNMTNGDYVYITGTSFIWKPYGDYSWKRRDPSDEIILQAYKSVIFVVMVDMEMSSSPISKSMQASWRTRFEEDPFYQNTGLDTDPPLPMLTSATGSLEILGEVLNETLAECPSSCNLRDGTTMARKMMNRTFSTTVGQVRFDANGERRPFLSSASYFDSTENRRKVYLRASTGQKGEFKWKQVDSLSWHGGSQLPPSEPVCGFIEKGTACLNSGDTTRNALLGVLIPIILLVAGGVAVVVIKIRSRNHFWWQLDSTSFGLQSARSQSRSTVSPVSFISNFVHGC
ncbi:hypothetical protein BV898_11742 [Hypsibius exemplaris]|uniref:Receptor ligand binding region domain-containing protein n=1 Tax=Hypsibius exemplaris TaxID=2072580 RepID=A0A1W0WFW2_HYPEX|nr:hypothetical protein BV898_11742 [Hypsibius exemplaris]